MQSILILGRQPALGLAEAESLYSAQAVQPFGKYAALADVEHIDFTRLGGSTRCGAVLDIISTNNWPTIETRIAELLPPIVSSLPEGKIRLGLSYVGASMSPRALNATGLQLKKTIKSTGRSVRVVPNTAAELNTAQVLHNQLTGPTGIEILIIPNGKQAVIARTIASQDINAYAARDQRRPKRDARVGMLPPKLAQLIVNLAMGPDTRHSREGGNPVILDPFCGTGVVLQEALLMGYDAYGTDLEPRMIEYSQSNLDWLQGNHHYNLQPATYNLEPGDATNHTWQHPFTTVACETYLGRPLSSLPKPEVLASIVSDVDTIHRKFLQNLAKQTKPGFRVCIAVPAWRTSSGFKHLRTLDSLEELGYNRMRFVHVSTQDLIYYRPDQIVARELVILQRI